MANKSIPRIEGILQYYTKALGVHYNAYRNHVYRVYHLTLILHDGDLKTEKIESLAIASAFHDLGVWTHQTMNYLGPSQDLAVQYMDENQIQNQEQTTLMIEHHHQLSKYSDDLLVEAFRQADLIDLSIGIIKFGLPASFYTNLKQEFPYLGFHPYIYTRVMKYALTNLWKPLPMMKI